MKINVKGKRITLLIDEDLDRKLRLKQAKLIQDTGESISFSRVINDTLRNYLKQSFKN